MPRMVLTRRTFLGGVAPLGLAALMPECRGVDETFVRPRSENGTLRLTGIEAWPEPDPEGSAFVHGVASGDPRNTAVILWTRVTPSEGADEPISVEWRLAKDPALREIVSDGVAMADASADFTVHVDATELLPGQTYYYRFRALGQTSVQGRTRTLPAGHVERMRIAVATCSNLPAGFFNAYALMAQADVDLVLHLGDYIYEYANGTFGDGAPIGRVPAPNRELLTLDDYRMRHAQYKTDADLQELHRQHPCIAVWDDHEVANNAFRDGAQNHQPSEGDYQVRKAAAEQAYREWMPLRANADPDMIYRSFAAGDLLDLVMLDTRLIGRDAQVDVCDVAALNDPERSILGADQERWLMTSLGDSQARGARWRLIGQQVMFAPMSPVAQGCISGSDSWDGYGASRKRVLDGIGAAGIDNVIVLTGDAHSAWANDVAVNPFDSAEYDPATGRGSRLVEFVAPAVSSPPAGGSATQILETHPHVRFTDVSRNGYILLDVTRERAQAEWYFVPDVRERGTDQALGGMFQTLSGEAHLAPGTARSEPRAGSPARAV
jgi:alkaline phosphatase D